MRHNGRSARKTVLIVLDLSYQSAREQLAGIYHFQQAHCDWDISLIPSNDPRFQPTIQQTMTGNIDGAIIKIGSALDMTPILASRHVPLVILEKPSREQIKAVSPEHPFAVIGIDNEKVGALAADYLANLGNFATYLFIHDPNDTEWSKRRGASFKSAMRKRRHHVTILSLEEFERTLPALEKPVAIFAAFDLLASNALKACRRANLSIPGEAVVLSVDNDFALCENTSPTLSSIRLAHENLGYSAAKALHALMAGKRTKKSEELPPLDIIARNSTTYHPPARLLVDRALQIIEDNKTKRIRVTDIARQLRVSPSLLKLRFRQIRNRSLRDTIIEIRLAEVMRLLKTSDYPTGQIAKMCGFSSSAVLDHLFKKKFALTPGEWRAQNTRMISN